MSLLEQVNVFKKPNRQHLITERTGRQRRPVYSSLNHADNGNMELKTLSIDVYASKYLVTNGRSTLLYSGQSRLEELLLPSIYKDANHDENYRRRKRKRPSYRKSLFHSDSLSSIQTDLSQLTARGAKPEPQTTIPVIKDEKTVISYQLNHAPPPSPSDTEMKRLLFEFQGEHSSRPPSQQSTIEKEGYIPFRLPVLQQSVRFRHAPINSSPNDIRSTLSNYLQRYY